MNQFTVKRTEHISPDTLLLTLQPKHQKDRLFFKAGQYAALGFKVDGRPSPMRCFSIVSSPLNQNELQFAIRIYGDFTQAVATLEIGDDVFVHGPFGNFVVGTARERNLVFLTGGIGITPFMSMIRSASQQQSRSSITLLYSIQSQDNIPFRDELLALEQRNPNLTVFFFVTGGAIDKMPTKRVVRGRISEAHLQQLAASRFNQFSYFICGPGTFISGMRKILLHNRVSHDRIITEEFTPTSRAAAPAGISRRSAPFWTYGLTSATMALGIIFIMALDLVTNVPKTVNAESANATTQTSSQPSTASTINSTSTSPITTDNSAASTANTSSNQTTTPTYTYSQPTYQYQAPVSSVS